MKPVQIVSSEERQVWRDRQDELRKHNSWANRKEYYPFNMDKWEERGKDIVYEYNIRLQELNKKRKQVEEEFNVRNQLTLVLDIELKKQELKREQEEKARLNEKRNETRRKNKLEKEKYKVIPRRSKRVEMIAAQALLELKTPRL
jgi:hypothetical protein|tara:strand:- start:204 stop:638 length:435 start_codon:yes stop_codon:yes gene_type:complete